MSKAGASSKPPKGPSGPEAPSSADLPILEAEAAPAAERLTFTIDPRTGRVDRLEKVDAGGDRREFEPQDQVRLGMEKGARSLEQIVERAFLAGMEYALGDDEDEPDEPPSKAEHELLRPLIQHSAARRLLQPEVLRRAALEDLVRDAISAQATGAKASGRIRSTDPGGKP